MAIRHTFRSIIDQVRMNDPGTYPQPTNRQLSRTETNMLTITPDGQTPDRPTVLGEPNGNKPVQVYSTGMFKSMRKGETRWVTGTDAVKGIEHGVLVEIGLPSVDDVVTDLAARLPETVVVSGHVAPADYAEPTADPEIPHATDVDAKLADMSKSQLVKLARQLDIEGRSAMDKSELYEHLRHHPEVAQHLH